MKRKRTERETDPSWLHSLLLVVFFFLGVLAGCFSADRISGSIGEELSAYLAMYLDASQQQSFSASAVCASALAYLREPVLAFLLGFTAAGVILLPLLALVCGFFPTYAVGCLVMAFGTRGAWMAVCFFGLRCLVTVPCFFLLGSGAFQMAVKRLRVSFGKERPTAEDSRVWARFAVVCLVLGLGILADLRLSPLLLRALLERLF